MPRRAPARRPLVPVGLLVAAAIAGILAGLLSALAEGDASPSSKPPARSTVVVPLETGPLRTASPDVALPGGARDRLPAVAPRRSGGDARVTARVKDPYGGPDWAVRTFVARSQRYSDVRPPRRVRQTCAQVGRILAGRFVWINPHRRRAFDVPVDTTTTTVCTGRSRPVVLGALRLPAAGDPGSNPQISATVVWGLSPRPWTRVALRSPEDALQLPALQDGVRLRVLRGDLDIGRRTAVAGGRAVDGGVDNAQYGLPSFSPGGPPRSDHAGFPGVTAGLRAAAIVSDPSSDRPALLTTATDPDTGAPCYAILDRLVDGEPVRELGAMGGLAPSAALCERAFDVPPGHWTGLNGGAASNSSDRVAERRRLRERRTLAGSSSQAWAFPRNITEVDIEDPLGVRTVRTVPLGRVSIVYVQRAGDLPVGGPGFFDGDERRVFTGRTADGTEVALTYWRPR